MIEYTTQNLFVQLIILNNPMKHWFDGASWEMPICMCEQVFKENSVLWLKARILSL
jgi:hypothetical protein